MAKILRINNPTECSYHKNGVCLHPNSELAGLVFCDACNGFPHNCPLEDEPETLQTVEITQEERDALFEELSSCEAPGEI